METVELLQKCFAVVVEQAFLQAMTQVKEKCKEHQRYSIDPLKTDRRSQRNP